MSPQWSPLIMGGYTRAFDAAAEALGLLAHARPGPISDAGEELVGADVEARIAAGNGMVVVEHLVAGARGFAFGLLSRINRNGKAM